MVCLLPAGLRRHALLRRDSGNWAQADTEPDPFQDLLGTAGVNTWTPSADASLDASNPTEAVNLDASIDTFNNDIDLAYQIDPLSQLTFEFDPSGFAQQGFTSGDPQSRGLPDNATADLAVGLDYALWAGDATGVGTTGSYSSSTSSG